MAFPVPYFPRKALFTEINQNKVKFKHTIMIKKERSWLVQKFTLSSTTREKNQSNLPYKSNQPKLFKLIRDQKPCNAFIVPIRPSVQVTAQMVMWPST